MSDATYRTVAKAHNEALRRGVLNIWTIYDHPRDFPHNYVARRFEVGKRSKGTPTVTDDIVQGELQMLRESFRHCGLTCLMRSEHDESHIVESWL